MCNELLRTSFYTSLGWVKAHVKKYSYVFILFKGKVFNMYNKKFKDYFSHTNSAQRHNTPWNDFN